MQVDSKILDDLARVAGGAIGTLSSLRGEVEAQLRQQFERVLRQMDMVSREDFEAARDMAAAARADQATLADRVATLEAVVEEMRQALGRPDVTAGVPPGPAAG